jgi:hypothetical protein
MWSGPAWPSSPSTPGSKDINAGRTRGQLRVVETGIGRVVSVTAEPGDGDPQVGGPEVLRAEIGGS